MFVSSFVESFVPRRNLEQNRSPDIVLGLTAFCGGERHGRFNYFEN